MNNLAISFIRTIVPAAVGALVTWLVTIGVTIPQDAVAGFVAFLTPLFIGLYYVIIRKLEKYWPPIGWLLGFASTPRYKK